MSINEKTIEDTGVSLDLKNFEDNLISIQSINSNLAVHIDKRSIRDLRDTYGLSLEKVSGKIQNTSGNFLKSRETLLNHVTISGIDQALTKAKAAFNSSQKLSIKSSIEKLEQIKQAAKQVHFAQIIKSYEFDNILPSHKERRICLDHFATYLKNKNIKIDKTEFWTYLLSQDD